ncbi:MAG: xylulokinase [Candidatus Aerophobetes bacterium]|nr:xylulokinase [Candidatus Aerophobetes bacterium]
MKGKYILAHDLGTTGNKATLYDSGGNLLASSYKTYETRYFGLNCIEQNPNDWWKAVCDSTQELLVTAKVSPGDVACISFSGHMMGCLPVDKNGNPLRDSIIWADGRSVKQAQFLLDKIGDEEGYHITGHRFFSSYSAPKIMWVKENEPEVFKKAYKFLHTKDYIIHHLTGKFATDYSDASGMNLFDLNKREWSEEILQAADIPEETLPEPHPSTYVAGEVTETASQATGLKKGTPVVMGGGDGPCAAVGAGSVKEGSAYSYIGSASWIALATKKPLYDPKMRTFTFCHLDPDMFMPAGATNNGGVCYQWLRDSICQIEKQTAESVGIDVYEIMGLKADLVEPGADKLLFLPYIRGERCPYYNPNARGVFLGLNPNHKKEHFIRAVLEGVAFNLRIILNSFQGQGAVIDEMRVIGGGARSRLWRQIMANIYNKKILRPSLLQEATSLGAAIAGGIGVGIFKDFSMARDMVRIVDVDSPQPEVRERYENLYSIFKDAYERLVPVYERIASVK